MECFTETVRATLYTPGIGIKNDISVLCTFRTLCIIMHTIVTSILAAHFKKRLYELVIQFINFYIVYKI